MLAEELHKCVFAHGGGVEDFACLKLEAVLENFSGSVLAHEFDLHGRSVVECERFLIVEEIASLHGSHVAFGVFAPRAHGVRIRTREFLDCFWSAAVGVAFTKDRVHGAAFDLVIARSSILFFSGFWILWVVRKFVALRLKFLNRGHELRY